MKTVKIISSIGLLCLVFTGSAFGQNYFDALRYNIYNTGSDPINIGMGGASVANKSGIGTVTENPAAIGLFGHSSISFNLSTRNVSEDATYLGVKNNYSASQTNISNAGFMYKMPTMQGSLVVGAAYNQITDFNRAFKINAQNNQNTITDYFNQSSFYHDIAYQGFALDSTSTGTEPMLRLGPNGFQGINQYAEVKEKGYMGEYSIFGAAEFQKNLYVGVSLAFPVGDYQYHRSFLERDLKNVYNTFPYDVNNIDSEDKIHDKLSGFYARLGIVYKINPWLNIAASYRTKSKMKIKETYLSTIQTAFDNGDVYNSKANDGNGAINYDVTSPGRFTVGASIVNYSGLNVNGSVEYVDYSKITMSIPDSKDYEITQNTNIQNNFKQVWNYRIGASYRIGSLVPRVGYAFYPSPRKHYDAARTYYSAGLGIGMSHGVMLNIGVQMATWKDNVVLYSVSSNSGSTDMTAYEKVHRLNAMVGLRFAF